MNSMNIQESGLEMPYLTVKIPEIKRFNNSYELKASSHIKNGSYGQNAFQLFQCQLQDHKPQLSLRPDKSRFTLVTASQDDGVQSQKINNNHNNFLNQNLQNYQVQLQKLFSFLVNQNLESKKQLKQGGFNTKNILRNICNAQNQYILFNSQAQKIIQSSIQNVDKFKNWINKLRFHTFQEFQSVWSDTNRRKLFAKLYKKLCKKFYIENAIPYIMNSRIRNKQTKLAHIRFLYRFLEGIDNPKDFFYFKLKEKQKSKSV